MYLSNNIQKKNYPIFIILLSTSNPDSYVTRITTLVDILKRDCTPGQGYNS